MSTKHPVSKKHSALAGLLIGAAAILTGCGTAAQELPPPATVTPIPGSHVSRLLLTAQAIQREGITTQPIRASAAAGTGAREVIPYPAVVYDTDGSAWTYVNTTARTFVRQPITIAAIQGDVALLSAGPPPGTAVVTVGVAELLGTEYNISGEQ